MITKLSDIPFEGITISQSQIALKALLASKRAEINKRKNNNGIAATWEKRAKNLSAAYGYANSPNVMANLDFGNPLDQYTIDVIRYSMGNNNLVLRPKTFVSSASPGVAFNNPGTTSFDATQEQVDECKRMVDQQYGAESSRAKSIAYRNCIDRIPFKNIITEHVGRSGGVLLYTTIKNSQSQFNDIIASKDIQQARWVQQASAATGMPQIQVLDVLAFSVMDQLGEEPEKIEQELGTYMRNLAAPNAQSLVGGGPTPDLDLRLPNSTSLSANPDPVVMIINLAITLIQMFLEFKKRNDEAKRLEQAFADTPPIDDNFIMKCWDMNGLEVGCDESVATIKRCFDKDTGEETVCPKDDNSKSSPVGAIAIGLIGLWGLSRI